MHATSDGVLLVFTNVGWTAWPPAWAHREMSRTSRSCGWPSAAGAGPDAGGRADDVARAAGRRRRQGGPGYRPLLDVLRRTALSTGSAWRRSPMRACTRSGTAAGPGLATSMVPARSPPCDWRRRADRPARPPLPRNVACVEVPTGGARRTSGRRPLPAAAPARHLRARLGRRRDHRDESPPGRRRRWDMTDDLEALAGVFAPAASGHDVAQGSTGVQPYVAARVRRTAQTPRPAATSSAPGTSTTGPLRLRHDDRHGAFRAVPDRGRRAASWASRAPATTRATRDLSVLGAAVSPAPSLPTPSPSPLCSPRSCCPSSARSPTGPAASATCSLGSPGPARPPPPPWSPPPGSTGAVLKLPLARRRGGAWLVARGSMYSIPQPERPEGRAGTRSCQTRLALAPAALAAAGCWRWPLSS